VGSAEEIHQHSTKVIKFIDLAGHEKYQKTTVRGMVGLSPDYALLTIAPGSTTSSSFPDIATEQHLTIALALDVPLLLVITKTDVMPESVVQSTLTTIERLLERAGKKAVLVGDSMSHRHHHGSTITTTDSASTTTIDEKTDAVPIFLVSNVTGDGLDGLRDFLRTLPRSRIWDDAKLYELTEVHLDDCFEVDGE